MMTRATTVSQGKLNFNDLESRLLHAHVQRLLKWNPQSLVRVVVDDSSDAPGEFVNIFAAPPMAVLSQVRLPLSGRAESPLDVTVLASDLTTGLDPSRRGHAITVNKLKVVPGAAELAVLPPDDGWQLPIAGVSGDVVPLVDSAVAQFRVQVQTSPDADALAADIWDEPSFGGLPLRVLHAARLLGLLAEDSSRVAAATRTGWKRLTTVRGQVFVRVPGVLDRPLLTVVR
jgi:hypothetical protein